MKKKIKTQQNKLWSLVKEYVKIRDGLTCQKCGKYQEKGLHTSHVIPKSHGNVLRWTPVNLKLLCYFCHKHWWHAKPTDSGQWFKEKWPKRWAFIEAHQNDVVKWKEDDYERMIEDITKQINEAKKNKEEGDGKVHSRGV